MSTTKRRALGKGLRSLIPEKPVDRKPAPETPEAPTEPGAAGLLSLDLDLIRPNRSQPRQEFDQAAGKWSRSSFLTSVNNKGEQLAEYSTKTNTINMAAAVTCGVAMLVPLQMP